MDAETGNTILYAGAAFQIYHPDGSLMTQTFTYPEVTTVDTFYTNDQHPNVGLTTHGGAKP